MNENRGAKPKVGVGAGDVEKQKGHKVTEKPRVDWCDEDTGKDAGQAETKKLIILMDGAMHNLINTTLSSPSPLLSYET